MGAFSESETRFLRAIKVPIKIGLKTEIIILGDSPGLMDTRGKELDVANQYGLIETAKKCHGVLPVVVLSEKTIGERCGGLKEISRMISGMFSSSQNYFKLFQFLFTKYKDTDQTKRDLYSSFCDAYKKLNDEEKSDKNFVAFFEELTAKMDPPVRKIKIIDPLN